MKADELKFQKNLDTVRKWADSAKHKHQGFKMKPSIIITIGR